MARERPGPKVSFWNKFVIKNLPLIAKMWLDVENWDIVGLRETYLAVEGLVEYSDLQLSLFMLFCGVSQA